MINGKDPFEGVNDAFLQGLGGGATYSGPINVMQVKQGIQEAVAINKINKNIAEINPNFNVNNLTEVYSKPVELSTPISSLEELKIAQVPNANIIIDQQIKKDLELGKINQEQANNIQDNFNNITKATQQLKPLGLQENVEASNLLIEKNGETSMTDRKWYAGQAFAVSSHYDAAIFGYFNEGVDSSMERISLNDGQVLLFSFKKRSGM